jgi:hypothetical protein
LIFRYLYEDALAERSNGYPKLGLSVMLFDCDVKKVAADG